VSGQSENLGKASLTYHRQFLDPANLSEGSVKDAIRYLADHGIPGKAVIEKYQLGVAVHPLAGEERFCGMLCFPYRTRRGGVKALKFRNLAGKPKYAQPDGQKARLYNTMAWFSGDGEIGVTEGEPDAIAVSERLDIPAVAIPGATQWAANKDAWRLLFRDFRQVWVFADGDDPGREMAKQVRESLGWRAAVISCPDGEDAGSLIAAGRIEFFKERMNADS
jgi:DNA primase